MGRAPGGGSFPARSARSGWDTASLSQMPTDHPLRHQLDFAQNRERPPKSASWAKRLWNACSEVVSRPNRRSRIVVLNDMPRGRCAPDAPADRDALDRVTPEFEVGRVGAIDGEQRSSPGRPQPATNPKIPRPWRSRRLRGQIIPAPAGRLLGYWDKLQT